MRHPPCTCTAYPSCPLKQPPPHSLNKRKDRGIGGWYFRTFWKHKRVYLHRWVVEQLLGHPIPPEKQVHHLNQNVHWCCPFNLVLMDKAMHEALEKPRLTKYLKNQQVDARQQALLDAEQEEEGFEDAMRFFEDLGG